MLINIYFQNIHTHKKSKLRGLNSNLENSSQKKSVSGYRYIIFKIYKLKKKKKKNELCLKHYHICN